MDNRYTKINDLVVQACERLRKMGLSIDDGTVEKMVKGFHASGADIPQIAHDVAEMEKSRRCQYEIERVLSDGLDSAKNLLDLDVQYMGITLNMQDIDLMMIASASSFEELEQAMSKVTNISMPPVLENEDFATYRQRVFESYVGALSHENDALKDRNLGLMRKLDALVKSGAISPEEKEIIDKAMREHKDEGMPAVFAALVSELGEEKMNSWLVAMRDFDLISKEGISRTTLDASLRLYEELGKYNSLTIDEEAKYGKVILHDGTFNGKYLRKSLDFAKTMGKTVRINTLVFYMDCPDEVYNLEESATSTRIAKEKLTYYVDETTKVLAEYGDTVRSVDVFNELLNRHGLIGNNPYMLRSEIRQDLEGENPDNIKSGWLKHLTVEDICDVLVTARGNLPKTDFMYNDDNLVDPAKLEATVSLIRRIQEHEKTLGVKLIDSIGTQMHIDNNVSKEQIRHMFLELSKLGLPIEVTEFDLAMTSGVEGLTPEEIEIVRQQKMNEVYEVIYELREECGIRGITIWSKTDSQNFRVKIANEALVAQGGEPVVETLHGGFYTDDMVPKSAIMAKKITNQDFNYHGHTSRCGHAPDFDEQAYVDAAKEVGISRIGFSDHAPTAEIEGWQRGDKMYIDEVSEYIESVRKLQEENPDMVISCGFEAEYTAINAGHLVELREQCDYMILGQHYVSNGFTEVSSRDNPEYPLIYAKSVCDALDTGIFDILAHPDIFMGCRENFSTEEGKSLFLENARKASYMICLKAKELGIPIELNAHGPDATFKGVRDVNGNPITRGNDGLPAYPHPLFWDVAKEVGVGVIYGADAHTAAQIRNMYDDRCRLSNFVDISGLNFVENSYNPVLAREANMALQEAYSATRVSAVMQETAMINLVLSTTKVEPGQDVCECLDGRLAAFAQKCDSISRDTSKMNPLQIERISKADRLKQSALDFARGYVAEARDMGCTTKEEYIGAVSLMSEVRYQTDPAKRSEAISSLTEMKETKSFERTSQSSMPKDKPKVYTYKPPSGNNSNSGNSSGGNGSTDGGFTSSFNLLLGIGILLFFGLVVAYLIK